ncbi:phosphoribosylglycinamide formyltransferase [bacterium SCSIO 12643]|nr:phosphoribosylglycinamide formyltransferase [bacterium SCSIO 12643]
MKNIAIFASGSGTNAQKIMEHFENESDVQISLILVNNPNAGVIQRAKKFNVPVVKFNRQQFSYSDEIVNVLLSHQIDLVVLAGFLWLVPQNMVAAFPDQIINIHPALLPKYGGKGMYGHHVHEAVIAAKEKESGITIHYVNEKYDDGNIIAQYKCEVSPTDTPDSLAHNIHKLEHQYFPKVIENILNS